MRFAAVSLGLALLATQDAQRPVRDLFKDLRVATDGFAESDLAQTTLDWATAESGDRRAIVYRLPNGKNRPHFIVGYKNGSQKWIHREIPAEMGSPLTIDFLEDRLIVPTHLSPSAGNIAILGTDLSVKANFGGFSPTAIAPDLVVFYRNMVHFAPAHPESLAVFDVKTSKVARLYPTEAADDLSSPTEPWLESPARRAYRDKLAPLFAAAAKVRERPTYGWDPDWFDIDIDDSTFRYSASTDSLEFTAVFSTSAIDNGPKETVFVVCTTMHAATRACVEHDHK